MKKVYDSIFNTTFYILWGYDRETYLKTVEHAGFEDNLPLEEENGKCSEFAKDGEKIIFIWTLKKEVGCLAHECLHAVSFALDRYVKLDDNSSELYCYLLGLLMREGVK